MDELIMQILQYHQGMMGLSEFRDVIAAANLSDDDLDVCNNVAFDMIGKINREARKS